MKLSVLVTTYKHEKYIGQCIESIIKQKTTFRFEFLIGVEEGDTETIKICKDYEAKYPDKIRVFENPSNNIIYINGNRVGRANFFNVLPHVHGEYMARCDVDDFWTYELKLQKQVDFLEHNPEYNMCGHYASILKEDDIIGQAPRNYIEDSGINEVLKGNRFPTCSMLFRTALINPLPRTFIKTPMGDWYLQFLAVQNKGKIKVLKDNMATYRKHPGGLWNSKKSTNRLKQSLFMIERVIIELECLGLSPTHLYRLFSAKNDDYGSLKVDENWNSLLKDIVKGYNLKIGDDWQSQITSNELFDNVKQRNAFSAIDFIYEKEAIARGKDFIFIKEVKTYKLLPALIMHDNSVKFIYQSRDVRDMALSWSKSALHRGDIVRAAKVWKEDQYYSSIFLRSLTQNNIIHHHTYEQLIENTNSVIRSICKFVNLSFEQGMLEHQKKNDLTDIASSSDSWRNLNKSIIKSNSKKYASTLSKEQIVFLESMCFREMEFLGYLLDFETLQGQEFADLERELQKEERHEKDDYERISESEKNKRELWMSFYKQIHPYKFV